MGAQAVDDHTLRLTLSHPAPYLLSLLAHPIWYPVHLPTLEANGGATKRDTRWTEPATFVGNGPFVLKADRRGEVIIVDKSPTYWDAATVRLNSIHFHPAADVDGEERAFRAGQLHITEALPVGKVESYRRDQPEVLRISPFLDTYFYRLNTTRPGLDNKLVRQALSLALDRKAIVEKIHRDIVRVYADAAVVERLDKAGINPVTLPPAEFDAFFRSEAARWTKAYKEIGIKLE